MSWLRHDFNISKEEAYEISLIKGFQLSQPRLESTMMTN